MKATIAVNSLAKLSKLAEMLGRPPYKVGAALSGGGVRGFGHVGVLQAMSEAGVRPDIVAGVSAGAVAAVFYASGIPFPAMMKAFEDITFHQLAELSVPKDGFFRLDRFARFLRRNIPYRRLEELPVKTVICATDIDHGETAVFEEGPLADIVIASCSIPVVFKPKVINGVKYVDGGVLHNLPASAIRKRCRTLYGVNVSPMPTRRNASGSIIDMAATSFRLMAKTNVSADAALCDHLISIDGIAHYNVFNLKAIQQIYRLGHSTARIYLNSTT